MWCGVGEHGKENVGINNENEIVQKFRDGFLLPSSLLLVSDNGGPEELSKTLKNNPLLPQNRHPGSQASPPVTLELSA